MIKRNNRTEEISTAENNVKKILDNNICIYCGVCYSICPFGAIDWNTKLRTPIIISEKCKRCGICLKACPSTDVGKWYEPVYNHASYLFGPVLGTYLGFSKNIKLRYNSSSGGFITQFLLDLLHVKKIDGAVVTVLDRKYPYYGRSIIASSEEEIKHAKGSKYTIASPGLTIKELIRKKGKFAVVGLPCHILAFKKAERVYKELKNKIAVYIGLFCGHVPYPELYKIIIQKEFKNKYSLKDIKKIEYRGGGWPGFLTVVFKNATLKIPHDYWVSNYFSTMLFTPLRCLLCNDSTAELADISVGDPWIKEIKQTEKLGKSLIVVRTDRGKKLLNIVDKLGNIELVHVSRNYILESQKTNITFKKIKLNYRKQHLLTNNFLRNNFDIKLNTNKKINETTIEKIFSTFGSKLITNPKINNLVSKFPRMLIKIYSNLVFLTTLYSYKLWKYTRKENVIQKHKKEAVCQKKI